MNPHRIFQPLNHHDVSAVLSEQGIIVFSEIHPDRIRKSPFYEIRGLNSNDKYRLEMIDFDMDELLRSIEEADLRPMAKQVVYHADRDPYAIVMGITKSTNSVEIYLN